MPHCAASSEWVHQARCRLFHQQKLQLVVVSTLQGHVRNSKRLCTGSFYSQSLASSDTYNRDGGVHEGGCSETKKERQSTGYANESRWKADLQLGLLSILIDLKGMW